MKRNPLPARRPQGGYILILVLVALVAMMISGIALVRSMDTSQLVAGNLASRNATINSADAAVQTAVGWLQVQNPTGSLNNDTPGSGYMAEDQEGSTGNNPQFSWINSYPFSQCTSCVWTDAAGNTVEYVIHRMTYIAGDPSAAGNYSQSLNATTVNGVSQSSDAPSYNVSGVHYYRVTVVVRDSRNTSTVIQSFLTI